MFVDLKEKLHHGFSWVSLEKEIPALKNGSMVLLWITQQDGYPASHLSHGRNVLYFGNVNKLWKLKPTTKLLLYRATQWYDLNCMSIARYLSEKATWWNIFVAYCNYYAIRNILNYKKSWCERGIVNEMQLINFRFLQVLLFCVSFLLVTYQCTCVNINGCFKNSIKNNMVNLLLYSSIELFHDKETW